MRRPLNSRNQKVLVLDRQGFDDALNVRSEAMIIADAKSALPRGPRRIFSARMEMLTLDAVLILRSDGLPCRIFYQRRNASQNACLMSCEIHNAYFPSLVSDPNLLRKRWYLELCSG
jgi:hypothetical protein